MKFFAASALATGALAYGEKATPTNATMTQTGADMEIDYAELMGLRISRGSLSWWAGSQCSLQPRLSVREKQASGFTTRSLLAEPGQEPKQSGKSCLEPSQSWYQTPRLARKKGETLTSSASRSKLFSLRPGWWPIWGQR